jgi:eukaryotic-like serine/threonine-protein kinase
MVDIASLQGQVFGQFELRDLLGLGGMSAVYRAYHTSLEREVAVKIISPNLQSQAHYLERFQREAKTAASLEHAHIVPVYDFGIHDKLYYLVMRLLTGGSLDERLRKAQNPLPLESIRQMISQLADALDYAHSKGIVHRDIKASNILFDDKSKLYLADFGIAKLLNTSATLTATGEILGTPHYMAPEQWRGETVSPATDIYAMGILSYLLLAGKLPFRADTPHQYMHKHLMEKPSFIEFRETHLPKKLEPCLQKALEKKPENRFASAGDFALALGEAIAGLSPELPQPIVTLSEGKSSEMPLPASEALTPALRSKIPSGGKVPARNTAFVYGSAFIVALLLLLIALYNYGITAALFPTASPSPTNTRTAVPTEIVSPTATQTGLPTETASSTATRTASPTKTASATASPSPRPTATDSPTVTQNPSATPTSSPSRTPHPTVTQTSSATPHSTETASPTASPSATLTPTDTPPPTLTPLPTASMGLQSLTGALSEGQTSVSDRFFWYAGDIVTIYLSSQDFDPFLSIFDTNGGFLRQSDDCGGTPDACLNFYLVPETGWYQIVVSSYSPGGLGNYLLEINYLEVCNHDEPVAIVIAEEANLRSGTGLSSPSIGTLIEHDCLLVLGRNQEGTWLYVETETRRRGWIYSRLVFLSVELSELSIQQP